MNTIDVPPYSATLFSRGRPRGGHKTAREQVPSLCRFRRHRQRDCCRSPRTPRRVDNEVHVATSSLVTPVTYIQPELQYHLQQASQKTALCQRTTSMSATSATQPHAQSSAPSVTPPHDDLKHSRRRTLAVKTPGPASFALRTNTSPIHRSPVRRLASAGHCDPSGLSPTRKSALFSGLPLTQLLEDCARSENGTLSTPDLRRLHEMIHARHGGAYPSQRAAGNRAEQHSR
jgi:hypothetical protein